MSEDRKLALYREWGVLTDGVEFETFVIEKLEAAERKHANLVAFVDELMDESVCDKCGLGLHVGCYGCKLKATEKQRDDYRDEVARQREYIERAQALPAAECDHRCPHDNPRDAENPCTECISDEAEPLRLAGYLDEARRERDALRDQCATLRAALEHAEKHCPCGARPEALHTHPHVIGCPVAAALASVPAVVTNPHRPHAVKESGDCSAACDACREHGWAGLPLDARCPRCPDAVPAVVSAEREALLAAAECLRSVRDELPDTEHGYGAFPGGDPRLFNPDEECSTAEERKAWVEACARWEAGDTEPKAPHEHGPHGPGGYQPSHVTYAGFGLGTYRMPGQAREYADSALAALDAARAVKP